MRRLLYLIAIALVVSNSSAIAQQNGWQTDVKQTDAWVSQGDSEKAITFLKARIENEQLSEWDRIHLTLKLIHYVVDKGNSRDVIECLKPFYNKIKGKYPAKSMVSFALNNALINAYLQENEFDIALESAKINLQNAPRPYFVLMSLSAIGTAYSGKKEFEQARKYYMSAYRQLKKITNNGRYNDSKRTLIFNIALLYVDEGQTAKSIKLLRKLLAWEQKKKLSTAKTAASLGVVYISGGDYDQACQFLEMAVAEYRLTDKLEYIKNLNMLGVISQNYGRFEKAQQYYQRVLSESEQAHFLEWQVQALINLGAVYTEMGALAKSNDYLKSALLFNKKLNSKQKQALIYEFLALLAGKQEKQVEEIAYYQQAMDLFKEIDDQIHYAQAMNNLGMVYREVKRFDKAEQLILDAIEIFKKVKPGNQEMAFAKLSLATCYVETGQYDKAAPLFKDAIEIEIKTLGTQHPDLAYAYNNLARLYSLQKKDALALKYYKKAVSISEKTEGPDQDSTKFYRRNMMHSILNNIARNRGR